jgi:acyl-CoA dehydrogenase
MDFDFSDDQREVAGLARRILHDKATDARVRAAEESPDRLDRDLWRDLAAAGLIGIALPEELGGGGCGLVEQCLVLEELGRVVAPVPVLASIVFGAAPIARFGTSGQRRRWVQAAIDGAAVLTAAWGEPSRGGRGRLATSARRTAAGWTLEGLKTSVPALPLADAVLVPAALDDGVAVFVVPTDAAGVGVERQQTTAGEATGRLVLDGVHLPVDALLGGEGAGPVRWMRHRALVGVCAQQLGVLEQALAATVEYTTNRVQFDRPIATFQAVGHRMADCYIDVEAARLTLWQAAWRLGEDLDADAEVGVAKYWAAEAGHRVAHAAVHLHGGMGVAKSHSLQRYFLAATHHEFLLGGSSEHLLGIGAALADSETLTAR